MVEQIPIVEHDSPIENEMTIHILRHGQALHNVQPGYPHRDPPLTPAGEQTSKLTRVTFEPDLVLVSPMTRTIQTAIHAFPSLLSSPNKLEIWPDLREAHDAECNCGVGRLELAAKFPQLPTSIFNIVPMEWSYPEHTIQGGRERAERVRLQLKKLQEQGFRNIVVVTHRCIAAFLVQGLRFQPVELRSFKFAAVDQIEKARFGAHCETGERQDYGPTLLVEVAAASISPAVLDEAARAPLPFLLLLNGFPGVGKYTIGKELATSLQATLPASKVKLIDNHSVIDIVLRTEEKHSAGYYSARKSVLRTGFFDKISEEEKAGMVVIMTSVFAEEKHGIDQWRDHVALVKERGFGFVQINLNCGVEVNKERLVSEERVEGRKVPGGKMKQILPWRLDELRGSQVMIDPRTHNDELKDVLANGFAEIDVTQLSVAESAAEVLGVLKEIRGSLGL